MVCENCQQLNDIIIRLFEVIDHTDPRSGWSNGVVAPGDIDEGETQMLRIIRELRNGHETLVNSIDGLSLQALAKSLGFDAQLYKNLVESATDITRNMNDRSEAGEPWIACMGCGFKRLIGDWQTGVSRNLGSKGIFGVCPSCDKATFPISIPGPKSDFKQPAEGDRYLNDDTHTWHEYHDGEWVDTQL